MSEYAINLFLAAAGFLVLLSMSSIVIHITLSHRNKFTGPMNSFYHRLGIFFIALFAMQALFPFYMLMMNLLRLYSYVPLPDPTHVFLERTYLALFLIINIFSFYLGTKVLQSMDTLVKNFSFSDGFQKQKNKKAVRHIYFTPPKRVHTKISSSG